MTIAIALLIKMKHVKIAIRYKELPMIQDIHVTEPIYTTQYADFAKIYMNQIAIRM